MNQIGFPCQVTSAEVAREKTLGGAISLCVKAAGYEPKQVQQALKVDKGQYSRWETGAEGIVWPKYEALMDFCGNDAPLLWMVHSRGFDIGSLRRLETETERALRHAQERITQLEQERAIERRVFAEVITGRTPTPLREQETTR